MDDFSGTDLKSIIHSKRANIYYLEHCRVLVNGGRVEYVTDEGKRSLYWNIPIANTTTLLLGTGTSITQAAMRELARVGVIVGFCGGGGTPLFSANEVDIEVAWMSPQSEYRPTEYLQWWVGFWFDDQARLEAARKFQQLRLQRIQDYWVGSRRLREQGFDIDGQRLATMLQKSREAVDQAADTTALLTEEARLTKSLFRLAAQAVGYGDFTRAKRGSGTDPANRFLDHGNYLAYGLAATATARDVLRSRDEDDWRHGEDIHLLAAMAALFHDLGKANRAFQAKLKKPKPLADAIRHEWVSLRLFQAFVAGRGDEQWLEDLADPGSALDTAWLQKLQTDHPDGAVQDSPFKTKGRQPAMPPLARAVGWLIVSHHRLPTRALPLAKMAPEDTLLSRLPAGIHASWCGWRPGAEKQAVEDCWTFDQPLPMASPAWRARARRLARRMLDRPGLLAADGSDNGWLDNPYVMHLSRLVLMLADHHYSSLTDPGERRKGDKGHRKLLANTVRGPDGKNRDNQPLDEHLIGVAHHSARIARLLPFLDGRLPRIARYRGFSRRSRDEGFRWQDRAYDLAVSLQERSADQGFFGVNMASTGCGKTVANGRIMYGLAHPVRGARFSVALGLRTLTLQTGDVYRERLKLGADALAVLVGGGAVRELFEHHQEPVEAQGRRGSESAEALLEDDSYVHFEGSLDDGPLNRWLDHTRGAKALLNAPVLVCTIDHLTPATEGVRGGRQIAPMLRLLTSDLVLDEPDEFDLDDLPALSRLVHWAGLLGSRVLLSSATLPPTLIQGLFAAYQAGRRVFQANRGRQQLGVCCAWFDEYGVQDEVCREVDQFADRHRAFVDGRLVQLKKKAEVRRRARISPLAIATTSRTELNRAFADCLHPLIHEIHRQHHDTDPHTGKRVSFGLVRMANIDPLIDVARSLLERGAEPGHRIHLCCYHAQHPLLVRSAMEARLDRLLKRHAPKAVFEDGELRAGLDACPEPDQIFLVLATPVAEVGRDHDYDWGIVEPSSMRSIIQLAGRIRRHRPGTCTVPNLYLLDTNLKHLRDGFDRPAYWRPGFERHPDFMLKVHHLSQLLTPAQMEIIDAAARIRERDEPDPHHNLVDLEHHRLRALMIGGAGDLTPSVDCWWNDQARAGLCGEVQRHTPFRHDGRGRRRYALIPDEETGKVVIHSLEKSGWVNADHQFRPLQMTIGPNIGFWRQMDFLGLLEELAEAKGMTLAECAQRFGTLELPVYDDSREWMRHDALGFGRYRDE